MFNFFAVVPLFLLLCKYLIWDIFRYAQDHKIGDDEGYFLFMGGFGQTDDEVKYSLQILFTNLENTLFLGYRFRLN